MGNWLNEISAPSLVMTGSDDLGCNTKINNKISHAMLNSQFEILENLKHAITLEAPQIVGTKIRNFLSKI